jgi:hypothetical protein
VVVDGGSEDEEGPAVAAASSASAAVAAAADGASAAAAEVGGDGAVPAAAAARCGALLLLLAATPASSSSKPASASVAFVGEWFGVVREEAVVREVRERAGALLLVAGLSRTIEQLVDLLRHHCCWMRLRWRAQTGRARRSGVLMCRSR